MNTHRTRRRTSPAGTRRPRSPRAARRARACHRDATAPASPCRRGVTVTAVTVAEARDRGAEAGAAARDGLVGLPPPRTAAATQSAVVDARHDPCPGRCGARTSGVYALESSLSPFLLFWSQGARTLEARYCFPAPPRPGGPRRCPRLDKVKKKRVFRAKKKYMSDSPLTKLFIPGSKLPHVEW